MRKPAAYLFAILVGSIIWFFFQHFKVEGTDSIRVVPKSEEELNKTAENGGETPIVSLPKVLAGITKKTPEASTDTDEVPTKPASQTATPRKPSNTIRLASLHLQFFGSSAADPLAVDVVAKIVRQFDVVALQGVSPGGSAAVVNLAERAGEDFLPILGMPSDVQHQDERFAYIYNRNTIVADSGDGLYTLGDPDNLLTREPLVAWFRAKAASAEEAFTFTTVNVNTDPRRRLQELSVLDNALHEIRNDGRKEDDVIMLGCFQAPEDQLGELGRLTGVVPAIRGTPTNLLGTSQTENILFRSPATDEFTGRSGVFHFLRAFNLTRDQALEVSDYLPVWAEFSIFEGGQRGRIASSEKGLR